MRASTLGALGSVFMFLFAGACAASSGTSTKLPTTLACEFGETATDDPAPLVEGEPVTAGQPTDAMAAAKRLYDQERYLDAVSALEHVADGETGDDPGNAQLAEYYLGVSLVKVHGFDRAIAVLDPIARNPTHLKHKEAAVWLAKLLEEPITAVRAVDLLYLYRDADIAQLDNAEQRRVLYTIQFARARAAYRRAHYDEALAILLRVRTYAPLRELADGCAAFAAGAKHAPPK